MKWIVIVVLLFGIANAVMVGDQWQPSLAETTRLAAIQREITAMEGEIETAETLIQPLADRLQQNQAESAKLQSAIAAIATAYPGDKLPPGIQAEYTAKTDRLGKLAAEHDTVFIQYQQLYHDYILKLSRYNSLAEEGMRLAQKYQQLWVFTPKGKRFLQ